MTASVLQRKNHQNNAKQPRQNLHKSEGFVLADPTRLELATSAVTGQRSNQLSYESTTYIIAHFPTFYKPVFHQITKQIRPMFAAGLSISIPVT